MNVFSPGNVMNPVTNSEKLILDKNKTLKDFLSSNIVIDETHGVLFPTNCKLSEAYTGITADGKTEIYHMEIIDASKLPTTYITRFDQGNIVTLKALSVNEKRRITWDWDNPINISQTDLIFENILVASSSWVSSGNSDYPYKSDITLSGMTDKHMVEINFADSEKYSGLYADYCDSYLGGVTIYCKIQPSTNITIESIVGECKNATLNNRYGMPNPNLLVNADFTNPLNRLGKTSYNGIGETIDGWMGVLNGSYNVTAKGLTINTLNPIYQDINAEPLLGKAVTLSAIILDEELTVGSFVIPSNIPSYDTVLTTITSPNDMGTLAVDLTTTGLLDVSIKPVAGSITVQKIKLENGSESTILHDFQQDTKTELAKFNAEYHSNTNLLDNGWFTINQRNRHYAPSGTNYYSDATFSSLVGTTEQNLECKLYNSSFGSINIEDTAYFVKPTDTISGYIGNGSGTWYDRYTVDRWIYNGDNTLLVGDDGITIPSHFLYQKMLHYERLIGKIITFSAMFSDGTVVSGTSIAKDGEIVAFYQDDKISLSINTLNHFAIQAIQPIKLRAVKVELGSVSTLVNDIGPDDDAELYKCQYYFQVPNGTLRVTRYDADYIYFAIPLTRKMRGGRVTVESLSANTWYGVYISSTSTTLQSGFTFTQENGISSGNNGFAYIAAHKASHGLTDACFGVPFGAVEVSADL